MAIVSLPLSVQLANGQTADGGQVMVDLNQIASNVNANAAKNGVNNDITSLTALTSVPNSVTAISWQLTTPAITGGTITGAAIDGTTTGVTQPVGTNNTTLATMAALAQQAFLTALPAQIGKRLLFTSGGTASWVADVTGNSGKTLSNDGNNLVWVTSAPPAAGTSQAAPYSFTATSGSVVVTPGAAGQYVTLDSGLNFPAKGNWGSIKNGSPDLYLGIKDNTGAQLGWLPPSGKTTVDLSDNSTQAGVWGLSVLKQAVTAYTANTSLSASNSMSFQRLTVDSNRTAFIFSINSGAALYAQIYDSSQAAGSQWGSATLIRSSIASNTAYRCILSAANQILVVSNDSTTGMQAVALTLAGTTVTVNTAATATLAGNWASYGQLIAVGSAFVVSYSRATTTTAIRVMTISGTTVTIGNETTQSTAVAYAPILYAVDATHFTTAHETGTALVINPYSVSGTTATVGTNVSVTETASGVKTIALGSGRWLYCYLNTTAFASIVSVNTGTNTATASSATHGTAWTNLTYIDLVAVSSTKTAAMYGAAGGAVKANVITDNAGTISNGTEITVPASATFAGNVAGVGANGTTAMFLNAESTNYYTAALLDCSGSSPVLSNRLAFGGGDITGSANTAVTSSDALGNRSSNLHFVGSGSSLAAYTCTYQVPGANLRFSQSGVQNVPPLALPRGGPPVAVSTGNVSGYSPGASSSESWFAAPASTTLGYAFYKLESAA